MSKKEITTPDASFASPSNESRLQLARNNARLLALMEETATDVLTLKNNFSNMYREVQEIGGNVKVLVGSTDMIVKGLKVVPNPRSDLAEKGQDLKRD